MKYHIWYRFLQNLVDWTYRKKSVDVFEPEIKADKNGVEVNKWHISEAESCNISPGWLQKNIYYMQTRYNIPEMADVYIAALLDQIHNISI